MKIISQLVADPAIVLLFIAYLPKTFYFGYLAGVLCVAVNAIIIKLLSK